MSFDKTIKNEFLTPEEAAKVLKISKRTIYEWIRNDQIPHSRLGDRLIRIRESDILNPDAKIYFERGCELGQSMDKIEQAEFNFRKAIQLSPNYSLAYFELGRMFYDHCHFLKASEPLKQSVHLNPSFFNLYFLGLNYMQMGQYDNAILSLERAIEISPEHEDALYQIGLARYMNYFEDAIFDKKSIEYFQEVLQINPRHAQAAELLGDALVLRLRDFDTALEFSKKIENDLPAIAEHVRLVVQLNRSN